MQKRTKRKADELVESLTNSSVIHEGKPDVKVADDGRWSPVSWSFPVTVVCLE